MMRFVKSKLVNSFTYEFAFYYQINTTYSDYRSIAITII